MQFTSEQRLDDGVLEREFTLGEIPGILWTPGSASAPAPLILLGHPGGLRKMYPRLAARARHCRGGRLRRGHHRAPRQRRPAPVGRRRAGPRRPASGGGGRRAGRRDRRRASSSRWSTRRSRNGRPPWTPSCRCPRSAARSGTRGGDRHRHPAGGGRAAHRGRRPLRREFRARAPCSRRPARSPFRCTSCCSGTTKGTTGRRPWTCSTPSAPRRRRCTPTSAGTPASRSSREDAARFFARHLK